MLKEFRIDDQTATLVQQTLTNTQSQLKFQGQELLEPFEIKTWVRQADRLSPILGSTVSWRRSFVNGGKT